MTAGYCEWCGDEGCASRCDWCGAEQASPSARCSSCGERTCEIAEYHLSGAAAKDRALADLREREDITRWLLAECLWLKRRMRQVLAELELTSCGVTANPRGNGGGAFESMPPKTGDWSPPWIRLRRLFAEATTNDRRRELVAEAEHELELVKKTRPLPKNFREETQAERVQRMLREGLGASPADISRSALKMSEREVRRYRTLHGRNPETGEVDDLMRPMPDGTPDERDERMRAMLAAGYSQRQAAHVLCVDQSTISRRWARLYRDIAASRAAA